MTTTGAPWRVLLVDDRPARRSLMRMLVGTVPPSGRTSLEVTEASDVAGAASAANRQEIDAAVVEIQIAGDVGLEVVEVLRAEHPSLAVVVCSFRAEHDLQARAFVAGADAYLTKPVSGRELMDACLTRRRLQRHSSAGSS